MVGKSPKGLIIARTYLSKSCICLLETFMKCGNSPPTTGTKKAVVGPKPVREPVETIQTCQRQEQLLISELEATNSIEINSSGKPHVQLGFGLSEQ